MSPPRASKIIAVHVNYESRAAQRGRVPAAPSYFLKPPSSLSGDGDPIVRPQGTELLTFEGEVALVISRAVRGVAPEKALEYVGWYAPANDVGVHDMRWTDRGSNVLSKGHDGFTPLGPLVDAADVDPAAIGLRTLVNGDVVQDDSTANLLFPFGLLVADLSRFMTLEPGDIILTGTPAGTGLVEPGDVVEVELDGPLLGPQPGGRGRRPDSRLRGPAAGLARQPRLRARRQRAAPRDTLARRRGGAQHRLDSDALGADRQARGTQHVPRRAASPSAPTCACSATPTRCATCRCARTCATPTPRRAERAEERDRVDRPRRGARDRRARRARRRDDRRHPHRARAGARRDRHRHRRRRARQPRARAPGDPDLPPGAACRGARPRALPARVERARSPAPACSSCPAM